MLIIVINNKITGVEKKLLDSLNIDLESVSGFINTLELQLSALQNTSLELNNNYYSVEEIDVFSTDNIKIFKLSETGEIFDNQNSVEAPSVDFKDSGISGTDESVYGNIYEENTETGYTDSYDSSEEILKLNDGFENQKDNTEENFNPTMQESETIHNRENLLVCDIKIIDPEEPEESQTIQNNGISEIYTQKETQQQTIDLESLNTAQEPEPVAEEHSFKAEIKSETEKNPELNTAHGKSDFEDSNIIQPKENLLQDQEDEMIEISFEDDLEEIRKILNLNKNEFNKEMSEELKKASNELGIEFEELVNWHNQLIDQIKDEKDYIYKYINKKDYTNLHESYHKLKGAALNLRLSQIALVLKKLDELSKDREDIEKIKQITDDFYTLIESETVTMTSQTEQKPAPEKTENGNSQNKHIENIVLKTIQSYLNTQNEMQFQKDKKYIEKLLNTKIDTLDDLEKIIKGM